MPNRAKLLALVGLCLLPLWYWGVTQLTKKPSRAQGRIDLQKALSDGDNNFAQVNAGRDFSFPTDHGEHPDFKTEWWYFTGNLEAKNPASRMGYQLTIFRTGLNTNTENIAPSKWATQDLLMGHFALSSTHTGKFYSFERYSRRALGLGGIEPNAERIWLEDWKILRHEDGTGGWTLSASAKGDDGIPVSLNLELQQSKPTILQGDQGYSRKGPLPENASYYVAQTRLASSGTVKIGEQKWNVEGSSWFDHEWSSAALAPGLVGWDWFSLQLEDNWDLMIYILRYEDGRVEPASSGALVNPEGARVNLELDEFQVTIRDTHTSPSGVEYPSLWSISVPKEKLQLEVTPLLLDQEMKSAVPYWEGAVDVKGVHGAKQVGGVGFVEMTGYARTSSE